MFRGVGQGRGGGNRASVGRGQDRGGRETGPMPMRAWGRRWWAWGEGRGDRGGRETGPMPMEKVMGGRKHGLDGGKG